MQCLRLAITKAVIDKRLIRNKVYKDNTAVNDKTKFLTLRSSNFNFIHTYPLNSLLITHLSFEIYLIKN